MNCFSGPARTGWRAYALFAAAVGMLLCAGGAASAEDDRRYDLRYTVTPVPDKEGVEVELTLEQDRYLLREMTMDAPSSPFEQVSGDGTVSQENGRLTWLPPRDGGSLRWFVRVSHKRDGNSYDARMTDDWALFRGTDIIPPARTRTLRDAASRTSLKFKLPEGWSSATQYFGRDHLYKVPNAGRRFKRPAGWMLLGRIGTRTERIAGISVKVTGPVGQSVRRIDMLALMRWTLPHLVKLLPDAPKRLTIFSASDGMWRGGLSGPRSIYLHADRPLISENATSTLLHEIIHVATGLNGAKGADWIVEGFAEYYSLELLRRSGTISKKRFEDAIDSLRKSGRAVRDLCGGQSTYVRTAHAVAVLYELDQELRDGSSGRMGLDALLGELTRKETAVSLSMLRREAAELLNEPSESLSARNLPGCK